MLKTSNRTAPSIGIIKQSDNKLPPPNEDGIGMFGYKGSYKDETVVYSNASSDKWAGTPYSGHRISMNDIPNTELYVPPGDHIKGTLKVDIPWKPEYGIGNAYKPLVYGGVAVIVLYFIFRK